MATHANRGCLSVDPDGNWRLYTSTIPVLAEPLGTVMRDGTDTGALVRLGKTGAYGQVNAGGLRRLDGRKVAAALGNAGRPPSLAGGKRVEVYLDEGSLAAAASAGEGNVSL